LPARLVDEAERRERIFKSNTLDPSLRTHKLHGKDREYWAFWIDYKYRIKFAFLAEDAVLFLDIGTHDIYK
jgi:mRNA-degrading endonuclease YafQ of YafQ-DinJ toxin-antitoxin module